MALDTKLKSDMENDGSYSDANRTALISDRTSTQPIFKSSDQGAHTDKKKATTNVNPIMQPVKQEETSNTTELLLKSIEKQLKSLNQSVADLEQEVSACKNPDYRVVFSKIDSARCSIEKMFLAVGGMADTSVDNTLADKIAELKAMITAVTEKQDRNDRQVAQTLRENANFQIQVRQGMQRDIDVLKEQQSGEQFNPILKEIASMYVEYQSLLEDDSISDLSQKNIKALFEQIKDLLLDYDAEITHSEVGDTRQTRSTKIIGKVPTADPDKHNTIAVSRKPGVIRGRTVLYPEFVDVFVYDPLLVLEETDNTVSGDSDDMQCSGQVEGESTNIIEAGNIDGTAMTEPTETMSNPTTEGKDKEITTEDVDQTNV